MSLGILLPITDFKNAARSIVYEAFCIGGADVRFRMRRQLRGWGWELFQYVFADFDLVHPDKLKVRCCPKTRSKTIEQVNQAPRPGFYSVRRLNASDELSSWCSFQQIAPTNSRGCYKRYNQQTKLLIELLLLFYCTHSKRNGISKGVTVFVTTAKVNSSQHILFPAHGNIVGRESSYYGSKLVCIKDYAITAHNAWK